MRPFFPALLLALFAGWCGTQGTGASGWAGVVSGLVLVGAVALGRTSWRDWADPLRLGLAWAWLPALLWVWCCASAALSPVPRSGRVGLLLLPAFLLLPAIVARSLAGGEGRERGLRALALATGLLSAWALLDWLALGAPRPAMPLGHHNLLAAFLVTLLPLSLAQAREKGSWRRLGWLALGLGLATLLATRSLAGLAALAAQGGVLAFGWWRGGPDRRSKRRLLLPAGLPALLALGALLAGERLTSIARGVDPSLRARETYWRAGLAGGMARPLVGWGPGSTAWTLSAFLEPIPGFNPPGEEVGDLHNLPLTLAYELGLPGAVLALALVWRFGACRLREARESERGDGREEEVRRLALLGLLGFGVASLGGAPMVVTALPVAAAVAAAFALGPDPEDRAERGGSSVFGWIYVFGVLALLSPLLAAQLRYDQARGAAFSGDEAGAARTLARAVALDPGFPLYRWRLALLRSGKPSSAGEAAEEAFLAARAARGVPVFWESAGLLGLKAGLPWAPQALARAGALAPMSPLAPFHLALAGRDEIAGAENGARAILGEPRLAWACAWRSLGDRREAALAEVLLWPGVDAGWRETLVGEARRSGLDRGTEEGSSELALTLDAEESSSSSLLQFHRRSWPARLPLVPLCPAGGLSTLPPAWALPTTSPLALRRSFDPIRSVGGQILLSR